MFRTTMNTISYFSLLAILLVHFVSQAMATRCYQCSSDEDKTSDQCGAYENFDTSKNSPIDCQGEEAVSPGTFCFKSIQQGPRGFISDGRWRTVIRRCAQVSERGVTRGCNWGFHENGVYWEECYCAEDGCNNAFSFMTSRSPIWYLLTLLATIAGLTLQYAESRVKRTNRIFLNNYL